MPDFTWKQGDSLPIATDELKYSNGEIANLEGATVNFVVRAFTATEPLFTESATITSASRGQVSFAPGAENTAHPGNYMANWVVKFSGGNQMAFPTTGYLWVEIEPNLTAKSEAQLVGLPEVKDHLNITPADKTHDNKLIRHIEAVEPLIENIIGPIRIKVYDEWHEGGHTTLSLRHKPSYGYGTKPYLQLMAVSEYRGPIEYNLSVVGTPTQGSVYSTMANEELGFIARRTSGGGTYTFWRDPKHPQQSIHVVYAAGQEVIPPGVTLAALETIRVAYENTMLVGKGFQTVADSQEPQMPLGFSIPRHAMEYLKPYQRAPAFA